VFVLRRRAPLFALLFPLALLSAVLLTTFGAPPASAHVRESTGYSTVRGEGARVDYTLSLEYELLARAVDLGPEAAATADDSARREALQNAHPALGRYLAERLTVSLDGARCEPELAGTSTEGHDGAAYARLDLGFSCPGENGEYRIRYDVFSPTDAVVDGHTNIVDYSLARAQGREVLDAGHREFVAGNASPAAAIGRFGAMGMEHLLTGPDHVFFVVALLLGAARPRQLVAVLSMFTLAHSLTLGAALLGLVHVPAEIVEPLIALSIAFVAVENLLGARGRMPVTFLFGLVHGLGFAGSLQIDGRVDGSLLLSLFSFNLGIEAAQLLLVLVGFPLILLVRRTRFSVPAVRGATISVAVIGLFWFVERFLFG
jgi:hydrogenase/urease accessory protein HupE